MVRLSLAITHQDKILHLKRRKGKKIKKKIARFMRESFPQESQISIRESASHLLPIGYHMET